MKSLHNKKSDYRKFKEGEWVLMWNAKNQDKEKHEKFEDFWIGPYVIMGKIGEKSYYLQNTSRETQELPVHG